MQIGKLGLALAALLAAFLAACRSELESAQERWAEAGVESYTIVVRLVEGPWHLQDHTVTVQDGQVVESSATCIPSLFENGQCEVDPFVPDDFTVAGLFAAAAQMSEDYGRSTTITFDEQYGYPATVRYDDPNIADEELYWQVTAFTPEDGP
jgi:hypothetical protein